MENIENNVVNNEDSVEETEVKTYTAEEVQALLQSETDRRVDKALKKQKKEYEKKISLSKLDDNEREKAEKDNTIAELQAQLAQFQIEKNKSELKSVLSSRNLSAEFADIIAINDDIEESQANIDKLDRLFKKAVQAEVEKRLAGNTPRGNANSKAPELTREDAKKLSLAEMSNLKDTNPELYKKLFD